MSHNRRTLVAPQFNDLGVHSANAPRLMARTPQIQLLGTLPFTEAPLLFGDTKARRIMAAKIEPATAN